jgi:hypothetical protein
VVIYSSGLFYISPGDTELNHYKHTQDKNSPIEIPTENRENRSSAFTNKRDTFSLHTTVFQCTVLKEKQLPHPSLGRHNFKLLHYTALPAAGTGRSHAGHHVSSSSCEFKDSFRPRTLDACTQDTA